MRAYTRVRGEREREREDCDFCTQRMAEKGRKQRACQGGKTGDGERVRGADGVG